MAKSRIEELSEDATRLLDEWLSTGVATLKQGATVSVGEAEEIGLLRLAMDLSKRIPPKRSTVVNPDAFRPKKTAVEEKPA